MNNNFNKFNKFLFNRRKKNNFTHNSKMTPKGTFVINEDEIDIFNNLYINALKDNQPIYINEGIKEYMPIVIDIDIKYLKSEIITNRVYSPILDKFIEILIKIINKYLIVDDENFFIFLLEKSNPWEKDDILKDGIHIITPFIWIPYELIYIIRNDIIKEVENIKLFDTIPHTNDINNIYDKVPYDSKLWLMFRSYDVIKNKKPYDLTKIYDKNLQLHQFKYTRDELIKLFSLGKIKYEYIAKTKISNDDILNMYKVLDNKIIFDEFLKKYVSNIDDFNYRNSYTDTYYNITDIPTFYKYLYNSLNDDNRLYLTQKTKEYGPIISDIDIYYEKSTITKIYPPEFITTISQIYIDVVRKYVNVDQNNIQVFILEKNRIPFMDNLYKDGIHLMMPYVCLTQENQCFIRDRVIEEVAKLNIFDNTKLDRIFDKIAIKNYWTIYGCYNQDDCKYELTKIYDDKLNLVDIKQYTLNDLIDILNIAKFTKDQINTINIKESFVDIKETSSHNKLLIILLIIIVTILIINIFRK